MAWERQPRGLDRHQEATLDQTLPTPTPQAGPLDAAPTVTARQAAEMLDHALTGLPLGDWDRQARDRLQAEGDPAYVATLASWLRSAWELGLEHGRAERAEEAGRPARVPGT